MRVNTYTVSRLCEELRDLVRTAYSGIWLAGEVHSVRHHRNGHVYLEIVEKGEQDRVVAKLESVIWKGQWQRIRGRLRAAGVELEEGVALRCRGGLDLYPPFGRLQFIVREVDPVFTLGELERRRRATLEALAAAGLLERNRALELPLVPLDITLITSEGSAAEHDFLATLKESGLSFHVRVLHAAVQGTAAAKELASALRTAAGLEVGIVALVRGGGARTDLAAFDTREVAEAVARCPLPVITGLGHETDLSIVDQVAHTAVKTPTGAAEFLVERVEAWERRSSELARRIAARGESLLRMEERRCREVALRLSRAARRPMATLRPKTDRLARQIVHSARSHLRMQQARVAGQAALLRALDPQRTLERGFSVTRTLAGELVRSRGAVTVGARLRTRVAAGEFVSRVEEL